MTTDRLPIKRAGDVQPRLRNRWLVKGLLPAEGLALLYGQPGSGKSFLADDLGLHIATGRDWHGRPVRQGLVIYVAAEAGYGMDNRIAAWCKHHRVSGPISFSYIPTAIDLASGEGDYLNLESTINEEASFLAQAPVVIIIDTLSKTFGGADENGPAMTAYLANCQRLQERFECLVMPVHHVPKDPNSKEPRGHGSLKAGVDTCLFVDGRNTVRWVEIRKQKEGETGALIGFTLEVVVLGRDEEDEPVTSCVVKPAIGKPATVGRTSTIRSEHQKRAFLILENMIEEEGQPAPSTLARDCRLDDPPDRVASIKQWRQRYIKAVTRPEQDPENAGRAFRNHPKKLEKDGIIGISGDLVWICS